MTDDRQRESVPWKLLVGQHDFTLRQQLARTRYIATVETSKHRFFQFLDTEILPDNKLLVIAHNDAYVLGVLSSRLHMVWATAQGSTLEDRPVYVKTRCFETFPFPVTSAAQQQAIRQAGQALDDHRASRLSLHPALTMTGLYNVLEKLRAGAALSDDERRVHDLGLVSTLRELHDELDASVTAAYGWDAELSAPELLEHLAALNAVRAAEERQDVVKFIRPAYQNPAGVSQTELLAAGEVRVAAAALPAFPRRLADQSQAVRQLLRNAARPMTPREVARSFTGKVRADRTEEVLEMLVTMGQAREVPGQGGYTA